MVPFPHIGLRVEMVLIDIVVHVDIGECVSQFLVIVVGDGGKRIENVWINWL